MKKNLEYYYKKNKEQIQKIKLNLSHKINYDEAMNQFLLYHTSKEEHDKYIQFCLKLPDDKYMKTISCTSYEVLNTDILYQITEYSIQNKAVCYMTFAKYSEEFSRKECYAKSFNSYIIDFDFYHEEKFERFTPEEFWRELKPVISKYPYSAVFSSGRGLYVSFIFDNSVDCSLDTFKANHKIIINNLLLELAEYGADVKCKDFSRVFKLAGSIHPKTGKMSKLIEDSKTRCTYEEFFESLKEIKTESKEIVESTKKVVLKKETKKTTFIKKENLAKLNPRDQFRYKKAKKEIPYNYGYNTKFQKDIYEISKINKLEESIYYPEQTEDILESFTKNMASNSVLVKKNHWINDLLHCDSSIQEKTFYDCIEFYKPLNSGRVRNIETLVTLRKGNIEYRNNLLLVYGIQLWFEKNERILNHMLKLNLKFNEPYPVEEVMRIYNYVMKNTEYVRTCQFNFVYFPYTSETFIDIFEITNKELEKLTYWNPKHCFGGMYSKQVKRCISRNQKQFLKQKRIENMTYDMKHMSVYDVAKKYSCSIQTVYNNIQFRPKKEKIKDEICFIGNMKKLNYSKEEICEILDISESTYNRRIKKFKNKPLKTYKTPVSFVNKICNDGTIEKTEYQELFISYIKDNKKYFGNKVASLGSLWDKSFDKLENINKIMFSFGISYWTFLSSSRDIHKTDYLIRIWDFLELKNRKSRRALTKVELLNVYISVLKNHRNLINGNIENLYLPTFNLNNFV